MPIPVPVPVPVPPRSCSYYDYETYYECKVIDQGRIKYRNSASDYSSAFDRTVRSCEISENYRSVERVEYRNFRFVDRRGRSYPYCLFIDSDPDGDGWGWENRKSCRVTTVPQERTWIDPNNGYEYNYCLYSYSDPDGDRFGEENGEYCRMPTYEDFADRIVIPAIDPQQWCESKIRCDTKRKKIRRTGRIVHGRCQKW